jgi:ABC-type nitrate/sulfonate/bicarbonate transport system substrate-binding protein
MSVITEDRKSYRSFAFQDVVRLEAAVRSVRLRPDRVVFGFRLLATFRRTTAGPRRTGDLHCLTGRTATRPAKWSAGPTWGRPVEYNLRRMTRPKLKTALVTRGHTQGLKDGTVKPRTFDFEFEEVPAIIQAFRRMVRGLEFDISEMAITTYICARAYGKRFTALPIFPMRAFHHGAIVCNTKAGIQSPKDLEGRKVGVNRGYTVTTGVWARGILQHQYGVDLRRITWVLSGDEHVSEWKPPANVVPIESGTKMEDLLVSGAIPAAIGVQVDSPDVRPLIANARESGFEALRERGLYPINHTLVVKDDLLSANPDLAADIFDAFAEAKRLYTERLAGDIQPASGDDAFFKRVMDITGDPLPYGLEANRPMLEAVVRYAAEQGIISGPIAIEELFPANT